MVAKNGRLPMLLSIARCGMKSYSIVAAAFSLAWPISSTAYTGITQAGNDQTPAQATALNTSSAKQTSATAPGVNPAASTAQNKSSYLLVELSKTLNAKKLKPGDKIKAEVSQDVLSHGKVIIPSETEVVGHVTEVAVRDAENPESRLGVVFDRIKLKHYRDINFQAVVQRVEPPVQRKSMVDQPSQMLPPSLITGDLRSSAPSPAGRSGSAGRSAAPSSASISQPSNDIYGAPLTVKQSPSTHAQTGSSAAQLESQQASAGGQAMSVGMPYGVTGLKGLSLRANSSGAPGPVIVSNTINVKLESGTQILLHVLSVESPQESAK